MSHAAVVDRVGTGVLSLFEFVGSIAAFGGRAIVEAVSLRYLAVTRVNALMIAMPLLTIMMDFSGIFGAVILPKAVLERATGVTSARVPTDTPEQKSSRSAQ